MPSECASCTQMCSPGAEGLEHFRRGVGEQAERQPEFRLEARMRSRGIFADAHHVVTGGGQLGIIVAERAGLSGAAGGVVIRIKVNNGLAAAADKVLGLNHLSVLVHHFEVGHGVSDFEHMGVI